MALRHQLFLVPVCVVACGGTCPMTFVLVVLQHHPATHTPPHRRSVYHAADTLSFLQGGLLCLAAIAVGLGPEDNDRFLDVIVPPVLDSFRDPDSGVRYYGLEALYNIAKVSRESFLRYFSDTFDSLFRLCADSENRVQVRKHASSRASEPGPACGVPFLRPDQMRHYLLPPTGPTAGGP